MVHRLQQHNQKFFIIKPIKTTKKERKQTFNTFFFCFFNQATKLSALY